MTAIESLLQSVLDEHRRIGSPLGRYLRRPGRDAASIQSVLGEAVLPPELEAWFTAQDGIDDEAWSREAVGPAPEMFWSGEPLGLDRSVEERARQVRLNAFAPPGSSPWQSDPGELWPPELVPVLRGGGSRYAVECRSGPGFGRVWLVHPAPAAFDPSRAAFPSLTALLEAAVARLRSGFFFWDAGSSSIQAASATEPWLTADTPVHGAPVETPDATILRAVEAIEAFARREGHSRIPEGHREGGLALGAVASSYRKARTDLPAHLRDRLDRLPGWEWNS